MVFGQSREEKLGQLRELPKPKAEEAPNPIQTGNIGIVNLGQKKNRTTSIFETLTQMNKKLSKTSSIQQSKVTEDTEQKPNRTY
jgi:hypothetical protein